MTPPVTHISPCAAALVAGCGFLIMAVLGVLVMVASIGYLTDSFANVLLSNYAEYETLILLIIAGPAIIGGLSLTFWLLS